MAGDGMLLVNFGALEQASVDIQKGVSVLQQRLDELNSAAAPLLDTWSGEARQAYFERQARWTAAAESLTQILQNVKGAVDNSLHEYLNTEKAATQRFQ